MAIPSEALKRERVETWRHPPNGNAHGEEKVQTTKPRMGWRRKS